MNPASRGGLKQLLDHARRATTRYAGLSPLDDSDDPFELLSGLPLLSRADLRRDGVRLRSNLGDTSHWRLSRTTGTTGEPAEVVLDEHARAAEAAVLARHVDRCLGTKDWRGRDLVHVTLHPGSATRTQPAPWSATGRVIKWNLIQAWHAGDAALFAALQHLHGAVVTLLPSVAELLTTRLHGIGGADGVRPALVALSGEALSPELRERLAEVFRAPITTLYALAEAGIPGTECGTDGGYHVEEEATIVELLDDSARPVQPGVEGEVVVTPLANRAMVLLRYRTGDRARWLGPCRCGRTSPRFELLASRRATRLVTTDGAAVPTVRFAKLLAHLEVDKVELRQSSSGTVQVCYRAPRPMAAEVQAVVAAAIRGELGPATVVGFERSDMVQSSAPVPRDRDAEPDGLDAESLARWLRPILRSMPHVDAAALTGTILDANAQTRFSDIDLVAFARGSVSDESWLALARRLRQHVPKLALTVDRLDGLSRRAPLFACRLLCEQLPLVGKMDERVLPWPARADLVTQARHWLQEAGLALWQRLVSLPAMPKDPLHEAWLATKQAVQALRFRTALAQRGPTGVNEVLAAAARMPEAERWLPAITEAHAVAREQRPPALGVTAVAGYLEAALACVRATAAWVEEQPSESASC